jgi:transposase
MTSLPAATSSSDRRRRSHPDCRATNGQTEGQITKLKLVKRQMYGRAKIDLLQARLIGAI